MVRRSILKGSLWRRGLAKRTCRTVAATLWRIVEHVRANGDHDMVFDISCNGHQLVAGTDRAGDRQHSDVRGGQESSAIADRRGWRTLYWRQRIGQGLLEPARINRR